MPYVSGFLHVREPGHPDQGLPGMEGPTDPGYGISGDRPDQGLPPQPPGVWPPLTPGAPVQPAHPIAGVPVQPGTIWPSPGHPSQGLPISPGHPSQGLPGSPGHPSGQPVPPPTGGTLPETGVPHPGQGLPSNVYWMLCYTPSMGWRFVAVDPSLSAGMPLPGGPSARPDQGLPPTATPRR